MNERIRELVKQSGGEFWQRLESDRTLNKEAYITFDPPQSLENFAELIVKECIAICISNALDDLDSNDRRGSSAKSAFEIKEHFGVE